MFFKYCGVILLLAPALWSLDRVSQVRYISDTGVPDMIYTLPLQTKAGQPFDEARVKSDSLVLYATGIFQRVSYRLTPTTYGTDVQFILTRYPVIHDIQLTGLRYFSDNKIRAQLLETIPLYTHLNLKTVETAQAAVVSQFRSDGYDFFDVQSIDTQDNTLIIAITEGIVSDIRVTGLETLPDAVITREIRQPIGQAYNRQTWNQDRRRLSTLAYLSGVTTQAMPQDDDTIHLTVQAVESTLDRFTVGLEQTDQSVSTIAAFNFGHVMLPTDQVTVSSQVDWDAQTGGNYYQVRYHQPWLLNHFPVFLTVDALSERRLQGANGNLIGIETMGWRTTVGKQMDRSTLSVQYKQDRLLAVNPADFDSYLLHALRWRFSIDALDNPLSPRSGFYAQLDYEEAGRLFGLQVPGAVYTRTSLNTAYFYPLSQNQTLGLRYYVGWMRQFDTDDQLQQYVIGGAMTLRGYQYGDLIGNYSMLNSFEYRYNTSASIQWVLFYDVGRTYNTPNPVIKAGYGIGARYLSRIGALRVDIGKPTDANSSREAVIYFSIGQAF